MSNRENGSTPIALIQISVMVNRTTDNAIVHYGRDHLPEVSASQSGLRSPKVSCKDNP